MEHNKTNILTSIEAAAIILGIMLDVSVSALPNSMIEISKQDAWISTIIGIVYPLYIGLLAIYLSKIYPENNIMEVCKQVYGNHIGSILNLFFFICYFSFFMPSLSTTASIIKTYISPYLNNIQIYITILIIGAYAANKGIKVISKLCIVTYILFAIMLIFSIYSISKGDFNNICPVLGSGAMNILKGSINSAYSYVGMEFAFFAYPLMNNVKQVKKVVISVLFIICFIYTWVVFSTIYFMGIDIIPKTVYSFFLVLNNINLEYISNFKFIYVITWIFIVIKTNCLFYWSSTLFLENSIKNKLGNKTFIPMAIIVFILTYFFYSNDVDKNALTSFYINFAVLYIIIYCSVVILGVKVKLNAGAKKE